MSTSLVFLSVLFGALGAGYCVYGRRQRAIVPFISGLLLIGIPYFIASVVVLVAVGVALAAVPFVVKI